MLFFSLSFAEFIAEFRRGFYSCLICTIARLKFKKEIEGSFQIHNHYFEICLMIIVIARRISETPHFNLR